MSERTVPEPGDYVEVGTQDRPAWAGTVVYCDGERATVLVEDSMKSGLSVGDAIDVPVRVLSVVVRIPGSVTGREFLGLPLTGSLDNLGTPLAVAIVIEGLDKEGRLARWYLHTADTPQSQALGMHQVAANRYGGKP